MLLPEEEKGFVVTFICEKPPASVALAMVETNAKRWRCSATRFSRC
jgi:hypothetical protein